jgi:hypothetical protein
MDGRTSSPLKLPLRHWACLLVLGCVLTGVLFTRCCGHLVGPVAPLLMVPFVLGSFLAIATRPPLEAVGFAIGLTLELALFWWLLRAAVLAAWIKR